MRTREVICLISVVGAVHAATAKEVTLPKISNVTKIVVKNSDLAGLSVKWITDTQQIQKIIHCINQQREGWDKPWYGVPSGAVKLELCRGTESLETFGIGENFFDASRRTDFWSKDATKKQREEILKLVGDLPATLKEVMLPEVSGVTKILIRTNAEGPIIKMITDPERMKQITRFINQQRKGWDKPWYGKPPPILLLELQDKEGFLQEFGIGKDFFETGDDESGFDSRCKDATKEQREEIMRIIELPKKDQ
jgi:hypothetical protein